MICPGKESNIYYFLTPLLGDKDVTDFSISESEESRHERGEIGLI